MSLVQSHTGLAIDAALLPLIAEAEEQLWDLLSNHIPLKGVRCRIRPSSVAIEIESEQEVDANSVLGAQAQKLVSNIFVNNQYRKQVTRITLEPYQRGSAFLIDTLEVET